MVVVCVARVFPGDAIISAEPGPTAPRVNQQPKCLVVVEIAYRQLGFEVVVEVD